MFSAVSERIRYYLGPHEPSSSRKRVLERDFSDDGDSDIESRLKADGPAFKRSRYSLHNGEAEESSSHARPNIDSAFSLSRERLLNRENLLTTVSSFMSSLGWTKPSKQDDKKDDNNQTGAITKTTINGHGLLDLLDKQRHEKEQKKYSRQPLSSLSSFPRSSKYLDDDIKYVGSYKSELTSPLGRVGNPSREAPSTYLSPPPRLTNGIDSTFKFSPSITSTAVRINKDPFASRKDSKTLLGSKSPITKDFPIIRNKFSAAIQKPSKYLPSKTRSMLESFTSTVLRKNSANARESYRLEEKIKYQQLLQQHANSGLASPTFKFPFLSSRQSSTTSSVGVQFISSKSSGGAVTFNKLNSTETNQKKQELENTPLIKGRPSIHDTSASPKQRIVNHVGEKQNDVSEKSQNSTQVTTNGDATVTLDDEEEDEGFEITAIIKAPAKCERNSLEESLLNSAIYRKKDWLQSFKDDYDAKKEQRERETEATKAYQKKLEEINKLASKTLEDKVAKKLSLLDLTFPPLVRDLPPEVELPPLTDDMERIISNAFKQDQNKVLANKFNIQVTRRDIQTLSGLNWLNDEVVNFYMNLLMERGQQDKYLDIYAYNTFFYPKLMKNGFSSIKRWTKKVDIFSKELLLVPVHLGMHWCLATMDMRTKTIRYYDSMLGDNNNCLSGLMSYLNEEHNDKKKTPFDPTGWTCENVKDIPQQMNGSDCGMFACKFAEYLSRDAPITFDQENMPYFRRRMVYEIVTQQLL